MPLFTKKKSTKTPSSKSSRNVTGSKSIGNLASKKKLPSKLGTKKEKVLELELAATGFKFGKGKGPGGWYRPFVQLTNANGQVLGRSEIISCATDAQWPVMRLALRSFCPITISTTAMGGSTATMSTASMRSMNSATNNGLSMRSFMTSSNNSVSSRSAQSESSSVDEAVFTQPLLLAVYEYNENGNHAVLGKVKTSLQVLMDRAKDLKWSSKDTIKEIKRKDPSFCVKKTDPFQAVYVKSAECTRGTPDEVLASNFSPQDVKQWPDLDQVVPPQGLFAGLSRRENMAKQISKLSMTEADETEETLADSFRELGYDLESDSDNEEEEEEDRSEVPAVDKDSLRRERAQAMIAKAQKRIERRQKHKKDKASQLFNKNVLRAAVRFADPGDDTVVEEIPRKTQFQEKAMAMRMQQSSALKKPVVPAAEEPSPAPVLAGPENNSLWFA